MEVYMSEIIIDPAQIMEEYNTLWKEQNEIYSAAAKSFGLSDSAMWILYFIRLSGGCCSQRDICSALLQPKQTTNSTIKQLESRGMVELSCGADRRCRLVKLTPDGEKLAQKSSDHVITAERLAMGDLTSAEQRQFIELLRKYNNNLKERLNIK